MRHENFQCDLWSGVCFTWKRHRIYIFASSILNEHCRSCAKFCSPEIICSPGVGSAHNGRRGIFYSLYVISDQVVGKGIFEPATPSIQRVFDTVSWCFFTPREPQSFPTWVVFTWTIVKQITVGHPNTVCSHTSCLFLLIAAIKGWKLGLLDMKNLIYWKFSMLFL